MKILFVSIFLFSASFIHSQDGTLDASFGVGGKVFFSPIGTTQVNDLLHIAIQPDGKIVAVGSVIKGVSADFITMRFLQNGSIDQSFGGKGYVITDMGANDIATSIAIQKDGKILVGGYSGVSYNKNDFAICRFNTDGSLDKSFNGTGKRISSFSTYNAYLWAIVLQPDGKILVGGDYDKSNMNFAYDFVVGRYKADGSLDSSFGTNGWVSTDLGYNERIFSMALQPDGKIVGCGLASVYINYTRFVVVRYNANGSLDNSFNGTGFAILSTRSLSEYSRALVIQPDGGIMIAGESSRADILGWDMVLMRYQKNGLIDHSFGNNGLVMSTTGIALNTSRSLLLQPDGKSLQIGTAIIAGNQMSFVTIRSKPNGEPDSSFGVNGKAIIPITGAFGAFNSAFQGNKIIVGGTGNDGTVRQGFVMIRLHNTGPANSEKNILVFPNPSTQDINVRISGYNETMKLAVYDLAGKKLKEGFIEAFDPVTITVLTKHLAASTYLLVFKTSEGIVTKKFIRL